jgi:hypothetical protein
LRLLKFSVKVVRHKNWISFCGRLWEKEWTEETNPVCLDSLKCPPFAKGAKDGPPSVFAVPARSKDGPPAHIDFNGGWRGAEAPLFHERFSG